MSHITRLTAYLGLAVAIALGGCNSANEAIVSDVPDACNPLGGVSCLTPWPSMAFTTEADTATGYQLNIPAAAMPINFNELAIDPAPFNRFDGFPLAGAILAVFDNGVDAAGLPPHTDPAQSLAPDSATIVLNMDTGERLLHFAEVDMNQLYPEERALIIRPLKRMQPASRYLVAIRSSVKDHLGNDLTPPAGFAAIRDGREYQHPLMDRVAARYDDIFAALDSEGVSRDEVVLAWDFVTASDEFLTSDLLTMRETAMPMMEPTLPFTADEVPANPERVYRSLAGTHQVPNFLTNGEADDSVMMRDASGNPQQSGMFDARFAAIIPECVTQPETQFPLPVMVFGHGLFGSGADYLDDNLVQTIANQMCFVVVAGDFIGLTARQLTTVVLIANDLNKIATLTDKLSQSVINFIALSYMVREVFANDERFQYQGQPVIDTSQIFYLGGSLGGIMGNTFMAYEPYIQRGALGVPGGGWGLLFERSLAWGALQIVAQSAYKDWTVQPMLPIMLGMLMETVDPITTAPRVIADPLPNTPAKQIMMYEAIGDSLVTNLSTEMLARTMDMPLVGPSLREPYGLEVTTEPVPNGFTIYNEHPDDIPPLTNIPPTSDNGTHGGVNERQAVLRQAEQFFFDGVVANTCLLDSAPAPCDCATGACD